MRVVKLQFPCERRLEGHRALRSIWSVLNTCLDAISECAKLALMCLDGVILRHLVMFDNIGGEGKVRPPWWSASPHIFAGRVAMMVTSFLSPEFILALVDKRTSRVPVMRSGKNVARNDILLIRHQIPPVTSTLSLWRKAGSDHDCGLPRHIFTQGAANE